MSVMVATPTKIREDYKTKGGLSMASLSRCALASYKQSAYSHSLERRCCSDNRLFYHERSARIHSFHNSGNSLGLQLSG